MAGINLSSGQSSLSETHSFFHPSQNIHSSWGFVLPSFRKSILQGRFTIDLVDLSQKPHRQHQSTVSIMRKSNSLEMMHHLRMSFNSYVH